MKFFSLPFLLYLEEVVAGGSIVRSSTELIRFFPIPSIASLPTFVNFSSGLVFSFWNSASRSSTREYFTERCTGAHARFYTHSCMDNGYLPVNLRRFRWRRSVFPRMHRVLRQRDLDRDSRAVRDTYYSRLGEEKTPRSTRTLRSGAMLYEASSVRWFRVLTSMDDCRYGRLQRDEFMSVCCEFNWPETILNLGLSCYCSDDGRLSLMHVWLGTGFSTGTALVIFYDKFNQKTAASV